MDELTHSLGQLERTQLVRRVDGTELMYQFKHVLAQETTYQSLLVKTRRDLHLRVAQYYEQLSANASDSNAAILAHHYFGAGDLLKTFHYALMAGDAAARLYAHPEALMHYDRALEMLHRLAGTPEAAELSGNEISGLYTNRGRVLELTNRYDLASENYIKMESVGRERDDPTLELAGLTLRATLFSTYTPVMDAAKGSELNARILARAREIGDRAAEAKILWIMSLLEKYIKGDVELALEHGESSLALARELGLSEQIAYTLNDLAHPYAMTGNFEQSLAVLEEAVLLWKDLGNLAMLSDTFANLSQFHYYSGDTEEAIRESVEALKLSQMTGSLWGQAYSQMWIGALYAERGEYGTAFRVIEECIRTAEAANFMPPQVATRIDRAWILGELGLLEQALQEAEQAISLLEGVHPFAIFVLAVRIRLAVLVGDLDGAEQIRQQESYWGDSPFKTDPEGMARVALAEAELALALKDYAQALATLEPVIEFLETHHIVPLLPEVLYRKGQVLQAKGDSDSALAVYAQAQQRAEALPSRRMLWQILEAESEIESERGNVGVGRTLRARGREVVEYISMHMDSAERQSSFLALPQVRALFQEN